ncbi:MAG TPA: Calx-beta domain-containing protein, partial [Jiangellaceae bacterium]|nr:Calx-beta domain-containing protein [Jiangellaceae bacterium]
MSLSAFTASASTTIAALLLAELGVVPALAATPATSDEPTVGAETAVVVEFAEPTRTFDEITLFPFPPVTVVRRGDTAAPASVSYAHTGGTATPGLDFELTPGTLSFAPGETSKTIPIKVYPDGVFEPDETIELTLGAPGEGTTLGAASSTVTIRDNDAPQVQFGNVDFTGSETDGSATITVTRTQDLAVPVGVDYSTSDGSALAGLDYTATTGTLSFGAGETSKSFTVPILDDAAAESSDVLRLTLSGPTGGAKLGPLSSARVRITDNDPTPTLRFAAASYPAVENGG